MRLKVKILHIATKGPLIGILNERDIHGLGIKPLDRIKITRCDKNIHDKGLIISVDEALGKKEIAQGVIGVFVDVANELKLKENHFIEASPTPVPESLKYIKKKLDKGTLNENEINTIIKDLLSNSLTEVEATYFVSGCYVNEMTLNESAYLTKAIVENSGKLKFDKKIVADKHSIGGIAGNRTTMIVIPIIAAAGITIPKTSTRSITSPAGTSDVMEVLAPVTFSKERIMEIVNKINACMVWGGAMDLASADDKLIKLEKILSIDPEGFLLASVLAKKLSAGSTHVLIDIPIGLEAKIESKRLAKRLAKKFIKLGSKLGLKIKVIITNGNQPIGNGVGPALEAIDVLKVLKNKGPNDLKEKSLYMASILLDMVGIKNSKVRAKNILDSGLAYKKMQEIIKEQGGNPNIKPEDIKLGRFTFDYKAKQSGKVRILSNKLVSKFAKIAGAPYDKGAGIYLYKKVNDPIIKGETLFKIYSEDKYKLEYVLKEDLEKVYTI